MFEKDILYILIEYNYYNNNESDFINKLIGIYETRTDAMRAVKRYNEQITKTNVSVFAVYKDDKNIRLNITEDKHLSV